MNSTNFYIVFIPLKCGVGCGCVEKKKGGKSRARHPRSFVFPGKIFGIFLFIFINGGGSADTFDVFKKEQRRKTDKK